MTYEEAKMQIQAIPEKIWDKLSEPDREAMEMAFSALEAQEIRDLLPVSPLLDKKKKKRKIEAISAPPEIIHCKDCEHFGVDRHKKLTWCSRNGYGYQADDFCSKAERRTYGSD